MKNKFMKAIVTVTTTTCLITTLALPATTVFAANTGAVNMYRMYNPNSGEHFYTSSVTERDSLYQSGWGYEGIGWVAPEKSDIAVYRLYNPNVGDHFYTKSIQERDNLVNVGWKDEGIGWYSDETKQVAILREYNKNATAGSHNYTSSETEDINLQNFGWNREGIAFYGLLASEGPEAPALPESNKTTVYNGVDYKDVYTYDYYLAHNPQVVQAVGTDPQAVIKHFVEVGMKDQLRASEEFSFKYYVLNYPELCEQFKHDNVAYYMNYINTGKAQGRIANKLNDSAIASEAGMTFTHQSDPVTYILGY